MKLSQLFLQSTFCGGALRPQHCRGEAQVHAVRRGHQGVQQDTRAGRGTVAHAGRTDSSFGSENYTKARALRCAQFVS